MKIIQLNLWLGHILDAALEYVKAQDPDVLCAQEVNSAEHGNGLFASYQTHQRFSKLFEYQFFAPTYSYQALGETVLYGNAIYSKHPLKNPTVTFTAGTYKENRTIGTQGFEIRNLQVCEVQYAGHALAISNHHGYHTSVQEDTADTIASMELAAKQLNQVQTPLVLCGDLNAGPGSRTLAQLEPLGLRDLTVEHHLTHTLSPAHRIKTGLVSDYILVSPQLQIVEFRTDDVIISDHKPLVLELA
jgi:endonuclease/exonuclease/phosphatase family metal-dependent hydrolase